MPTHIFYKTPGLDITWSLGDLTLKITDAVNQAKGFIPYLPNGASLKSRILTDNDFARDSPCRWLLSHLANKGLANWVGDIRTSNPDTNPYWTDERMQSHWDAEAKLVIGMNNIPKMVRGSTRKYSAANLERSAGTDLIIQYAFLCTPENPLILLVGGQCTTVANAIRINPTIKDRIVIFHTNGIYDKYESKQQGYNTMDYFAAYDCMKNSQYVNVNFKGLSQEYWYTGKNLGLTLEMIKALPDNNMTTALENWFNTLFPKEGMADATPLLWLLNPKVWTSIQKRRENGTVTTGEDYDYIFVDGHNWPLYGPTLINGFKL